MDRKQVKRRATDKDSPEQQSSQLLGVQSVKTEALDDCVVGSQIGEDWRTYQTEFQYVSKIKYEDEEPQSSGGNNSSQQVVFTPQFGGHEVAGEQTDGSVQMYEDRPQQCTGVIDTQSVKTEGLDDCILESATGDDDWPPYQTEFQVVKKIKAEDQECGEITDTTENRPFSWEPSHIDQVEHELFKSEPTFQEEEYAVEIDDDIMIKSDPEIGDDTVIKSEPQINKNRVISFDSTTKEKLKFLGISASECESDDDCVYNSDGYTIVKFATTSENEGSESGEREPQSGLDGEPTIKEEIEMQDRSLFEDESVYGEDDNGDGKENRLAECEPTEMQRECKVSIEYCPLIEQYQKINRDCNTSQASYEEVSRDTASEICKPLVKEKVYKEKGIQVNPGPSTDTKKHELKSCKFIIKKCESLDKSNVQGVDDKNSESGTCEHNELHHCNQCEYVTEYKDLLIQHIKGKHQLRIYHCQQCRYATRSPQYLAWHVKANHDPRTDRYRCDHCPYTTRHKYYLIRHLKVKHEQNTAFYQCQLCCYMTQWKPYIVSHFKTNHSESGSS